MPAPEREIIATGDTVSLGSFLPSDFAAVHQYATDPMVYRYAEWGPNSEADTRQYLAEATTPSASSLTLAVLVAG